MNRLAVALAADSAATVGSGRGQKIYQSVNKLFTLSKFHPVGIMVYNNAEFLNIPWETIIKMYREQLQTTYFDCVEDYAKDFISYLNGNQHLFPKDRQSAFFKRLITRQFGHIVESTNKKIWQLVFDKKETDPSEQLDNTIKEFAEEWDDKKDLSCFPKRFGQSIKREYTSIINEAIDEEFKAYELGEESRNLLSNLAAHTITKDDFIDSYSGLVIAGFGEQQMFPAMHSYTVGGIIRNKLKYRSDHSDVMTDNSIPVIRPFAQSDMIVTFTAGIDPNYRRKLYRQTIELARKLPKTIIDSIDDLDAQQKEAWNAKLKKEIIGPLRDFFEELDKYRIDQHYLPVVMAIGNLPKDEIAATAEALVNLNLFQKKVSMEAETVGGPIDVAVVTKGDGFIWIKRKHYFEPERNYHFFKNYFLNIVSDDKGSSQDASREQKVAQKSGSGGNRGTTTRKR